MLLLSGRVAAELREGAAAAGGGAALLPSILSGFQVAAGSGPLCEEPMAGVAFIIDDLTLQKQPGAEAGAGEGIASGATALAAAPPPDATAAAAAGGSADTALPPSEEEAAFDGGFWGAGQLEGS